MTKQEAVSKVISDLRANVTDIKGVLIATTDGLAIGHSLTSGDPNRIAAMGATALGLGKRVAESVGVGEMNEIAVAGTAGQLFIYAAGVQSVLIIVAGEFPNVGLINLEARSAAKNLSTLL